MGWLGVRKEAIINDDNTFQKALDDSLNYQKIETHTERISNIVPYVGGYNWEGIEFLAGSKKLNKIIRQLPLMYYLYHTIQKQ